MSARLRRPTRRDLLSGALVVAFFAAVAFVAINAGRGSKQSQSNKTAIKATAKQSTKAVVKSAVASKKADQSLRLNAKIVRCLTKLTPRAAAACLGLQPGAPGRPGAGGLPGTPGRSIRGQPGLRGLRGPPGKDGVNGSPGAPCGLPECRGPTGDAGRPPTASEIADAVSAYCADHDQCRGADGKDGSNGSDGSPGSPGADGAPGGVGPTGPTGPAGADGAPCPNTTTVTGVEGPTVVCTP